MYRAINSGKIGELICMVRLMKLEVPARVPADEEPPPYPEHDLPPPDDGWQAQATAPRQRVPRFAAGPS